MLHGSYLLKGLLGLGFCSVLFPNRHYCNLKMQSHANCPEYIL